MRGKVSNCNTKALWELYGRRFQIESVALFMRAMYDTLARFQVTFRLVDNQGHLNWGIGLPFGSN